MPASRIITFLVVAVFAASAISAARGHDVTVAARQYEAQAAPSYPTPTRGRKSYGYGGADYEQYVPVVHGPQGAPGPQGATGDEGDDGAPGATGDQGATGAPGLDGAAGATGDQGAPGLDGAAGATGDQGATGAPGLDGAAGATGDQGAPGLDGAAGATGAPGLDGAAGATGDQGVPGAAGVCASGTLYVAKSQVPVPMATCKAANPDDTQGNSCMVAQCVPGDALVEGGCNDNDGTGRTSAPLCVDGNGVYILCPGSNANVVGWACSSTNAAATSGGSWVTKPFLSATAVCCGAGCVANLAGPSTCTTNSDCCGGYCDTGIGGNGGTTGDKQCKDPCFSGKTLVKTLEHPAPIPIEDLKTGDHVQCADTNDDMRLPTTVKYCEVFSWLHAKSTPVNHRRITFARPDGTPGTLTLSPSHLMVRLAEPEATAGRTAASADAFGKLEHVVARLIMPGDQLVVLVDETAPEAGWVSVVVTGVESLELDGMYTPALESPYIIADGVVTPLYVDLHDNVDAKDGLDAADIAALHYQHAPAFTQRLTPVGVAGKDAAALGAVLPTEEGTGLVPIWRAKEAIQRVSSDKVLSFSALRDYFLPRLAAWKADPTKVVTVQEVAAVMASPSSWVHAKPGQRKGLKGVTLEKAVA